ncbi:MAG: DNA repair protein RecN [Methanobrevibacter sp.]|nr:DNA repair protein RecN [Methanobrevibacter sp.]
MLQELQIENVAVIEKAVVSFGERFNVLTGETGAGKSILIDSINAILGNRTNKEIVRSGEQKASILASFAEVPQDVKKHLNDLGFEVDQDLILSRDIFAEGRSVCRINGKPATASVVKEACQGLVNIHGQLDNQELLDPERHVDILDRYADLGDLLAIYSNEFSELLDLQKQINQLQMNETEKANRIDLLTYQIDEIDKAQLKINEEQDLQTRRNILKNTEKIRAVLSNVIGMIDDTDSVENESALNMIQAASNEIEHISDISDDYKVLSTRLNNTYYEIKDIYNTLNEQISSIDYDSNELNAIEERLDLLFKLRKKYGNTVSEILEYRDSAAAELNKIVMSDELLETLKNEFSDKKKSCIKLATDLSKARIDAFSLFSEKIKEELRYLNMPMVDFKLYHNRTKELTPRGIDEMEFLISANPGENPKALSKIASGGEMARIMLAIKNVLADKDGIPTLIFDEIDTGVSGTGAQKIGEKLKQISGTHQVICVTHSAQVASYASTHLKIEKSINNGRTFTSVTQLDYDDRVKELARIISGDNITDISLKNANQMLSIAQKN